MVKLGVDPGYPNALKKKAYRVQMMIKFIITLKILQTLHKYLGKIQP